MTKDQNLEKIKLASSSVKKLRNKILVGSTSNRNKLINYKHIDKKRDQVRIVDELPDQIYSRLYEGKDCVFKPLPEPDYELKDEKTTKFKMEFESGKKEDEVYLKEIDKLGDKYDGGSKVSLEVERRLKDRIRNKLHLKKRKTPEILGVNDYAKSKGINPSFTLPNAKKEISEKHNDKFLQTIQLPEQLDRKLIFIKRTSKKALNEKGIDTLFLAIGFLEWFEHSKSEVKILSPLLLYPVNLEENKKKSGIEFEISGPNNDLQLNIVLKAKLEKDFGLILPSIEEEETPEKYFLKLQEAIKSRKRWSLKRFVTFGIFDFTRMAMYNDLDPNNWLNLGEQNTLQDIFSGTSEGDGLTAEEYDVDDEKNHSKVPLLLNSADASQFSAVIDAMNGKNLALQGPPGTGKSQTITNIIGAALAQHKKVLFLADKKAALDVVYKKLQESGLHDYCLKIPSTNVKKIEVIENIKRRVEAKSKKINKQDLEFQIKKEQNVKNELIDYAKIITTKIGNSEKNIYELNGLRAKYKEFENKDFSFFFNSGSEKLFPENKIQDITPQKITLITDSLNANEKQSIEIKKKYKNIKNHPLSGFIFDSINPYEKKEFFKSLNYIQKIENDFFDIYKKLKTYKIKETENLNNFNQIKQFKDNFLTIFDEDHLNKSLYNIKSYKDVEKLKEFFKQILSIQDNLILEKKVLDKFKFKTSDFSKIDKLKKIFSKSGIFSVFSTEYRDAKKKYLTLSKTSTFSKSSAIKNLEIYSSYKKVYKSLIEKKGIIENSKSIKKMLGNEFSGLSTNPKLQEVIVNQLNNLEKKIQKNSITLFLKDKNFLKNFKNDFNKFINITDKIILNLKDISGKIDETFFNGHFDSVKFNEIFQKIKKINSDLLDEWINFIQAKKNNTETENFILQYFDEHEKDYINLSNLFLALYYNFLLKEAYNQYPNLSKYNGKKLDELRAEYKSLDKVIGKSKKERLLYILNNKRIDQGISRGPTKKLTEFGLLNRVMGQKRPQISLRNLIKNSSEALSQLKPCFMMSPVSLSELVRPQEDLFDILIIDEASQMRMEDSIGGLARSSQCIIVGDQQQLAPTGFFEISDEETDDEDLVEESILDLAASRFKPKRMLRWHYRSRNEKLINFSNKFFYDNQLIIPPSPSLKKVIHYNFVKSLYKGKINNQEKDDLIKGLIDFMKQNIRKDENDTKSKSCLVVTMNMHQKELIEDEIRLIENSNNIISDYKQSWDETLEKFEVKNLESVQGDERDCIFISTLFGPNENGKVLQQFGPINVSEKGHRRLNVLFTRAKKEIYLYTSIQPNQILVEDAPQGRIIFKNYIEYAKTGKLETGDTTEGKEPMSEFEVFVKNGLENYGYEVIPQVGVSGFFIDLGIKHKKYPDGFILGVECDGRAYHSSRSQRDNDILRQSVLEDMGWKIYRIWSTDWFENPQRELNKLDKYIKKLI